EKHARKRPQNDEAKNNNHEAEEKAEAKNDNHEAEEKAFEPVVDDETVLQKPQIKAKVKKAGSAELNFKLIHEIELLNENYGEVKVASGCVSTDEWKLPLRANINDEIAGCLVAMPGMGTRDFKHHELIHNKPRYSVYYKERLRKKEVQRLQRGGRAKFFLEDLKILDHR
ncbi:MAG: hypothetical protein GY938_25650, partial [Ketobacter sp.]|nr:hypothetical protein [Ketobacter sp.]